MQCEPSNQNQLSCASGTIVTSNILTLAICIAMTASVNWRTAKLTSAHVARYFSTAERRLVVLHYALMLPMLELLLVRLPGTTEIGIDTLGDVSLLTWMTLNAAALLLLIGAFFAVRGFRLLLHAAQCVLATAPLAIVCDRLVHKSARADVVIVALCLLCSACEIIVVLDYFDQSHTVNCDVADIYEDACVPSEDSGTLEMRSVTAFANEFPSLANSRSLHGPRIYGNRFASVYQNFDDDDDDDGIGSESETMYERDVPAGVIESLRKDKLARVESLTLSRIRKVSVLVTYEAAYELVMDMRSQLLRCDRSITASGSCCHTATVDSLTDSATASLVCVKSVHSPRRVKSAARHKLSQTNVSCDADDALLLASVDTSSLAPIF